MRRVLERLAVELDVGMTTRDGVRLAADVYRPDDGGRHPVLLHRTPYDKGHPESISAYVAEPAWLARHGYAVVVQDVRGRFASEGTWDFVRQEESDGYDAVEWAAAQPWSDGNVGIYGASYQAMSTCQAVAARPPSLRAAVALVGSDDLASMVRPGGLLELGFWANYALRHGANAIARLDLPATQLEALRVAVQRAVADPLAALQHLPVSEQVICDDLIAPFWSRFLQEPDAPYWHASRLARVDRLQVPLLQVAGFMDFLTPSMLELFERVQADRHHRLVVGPWTHYGAYDAKCGARDYKGTADGGPATFGPLLVAWFDHWLKGGGAALPAPVRYFSSGDDRWRESPTWPPQGEPVTYFLRSTGAANSRHGDGALAAERPGSEPPDTFPYDPLDPVPSHGGPFCSPQPAVFSPGGVQDQRVVEERPDVLVYTSPALVEPLRVAGRVSLTVYAASSAEDTDFTAKLVDVAPSGFAAPVSEGALRARYRRGGHEDWLVPGEVTELTIDLHQTAHCFRAGHRLRVSVTSSCFPRFSRNLNTRVVPERGTAGDVVVAQQTVHHDARHPSRVTLHRVPA